MLRFILLGILQSPRGRVSLQHMPEPRASMRVHENNTVEVKRDARASLLIRASDTYYYYYHGP